MLSFLASGLTTRRANTCAYSCSPSDSLLQRCQPRHPFPRSPALSFDTASLQARQTPRSPYVDSRSPPLQRLLLIELPRVRLSETANSEAPIARRRYRSRRREAVVLELLRMRKLLVDWVPGHSVSGSRRRVVVGGSGQEGTLLVMEGRVVRLARYSLAGDHSLASIAAGESTAAVEERRVKLLALLRVAVGSWDVGRHSALHLRLDRYLVFLLLMLRAHHRWWSRCWATSHPRPRRPRASSHP